MMEDKEFPETPNFIDVDGNEGYIEIYPTSDMANPVTGLKNPSLVRMNLLNMVMPCNLFPTCTVE